jgi:type IV secretory pathway component VirB8
LIHKLYNKEAIPEFENAVRLDSNFAMAYNYLAILNYEYLGDKNEAKGLSIKPSGFFRKSKRKKGF